MPCSSMNKFHAKQLKPRSKTVDFAEFIGPDWDGWILGLDGVLRCPQFPHGLHPKMIYVLQLEYLNCRVFEAALRQAQARIAELENLLSVCDF